MSAFEGDWRSQLEEFEAAARFTLKSAGAPVTLRGLRDYRPHSDAERAAILILRAAAKLRRAHASGQTDEALAALHATYVNAHFLEIAWFNSDASSATGTISAQIAQSIARERRILRLGVSSLQRVTKATEKGAPAAGRLKGRVTRERLIGVVEDLKRSDTPPRALAKRASTRLQLSTAYTSRLLKKWHLR